MKIRITLIIILACSVSFGVTLTQKEFTQILANRIGMQFPDCRVAVISEDEISFVDQYGEKMTIYAINAYDQYIADPDSFEETMEKYLEWLAFDTDTICANLMTVDYIVPVIKNAGFYKYMNEAFKDNNGLMAEKLNDELFVLYAIDGVLSIKYIPMNEFNGLGIPTDSLKTLAITNLSRIIPDITCYQADGIYYFAVGGDYEASLLLIDDVWADTQLVTKGDLIAAVPARDLLAITGSEDSLGMERIREFACEYFNCSYPISNKLFIRKDNSWEVYNDTVCRDKADGVQAPYVPAYLTH